VEKVMRDFNLSTYQHCHRTSINISTRNWIPCIMPLCRTRTKISGAIDHLRIVAIIRNHFFLNVLIIKIFVLNILSRSISQECYQGALYYYEFQGEQIRWRWGRHSITDSRTITSNWMIYIIPLFFIFYK